MNFNRQKITGILLAGGMSKRFGQDKGKIKIGDRFLYRYALDTLEQVCDEILISTCNELYDWSNYTSVCDKIPGIGPMGGIYTCLQKSGTEINIILSYDLPLVNKELLFYLLGELNGFDVVVPSLKVNSPEPLCGIYRKTVADKFSYLIKEKKYAVHSVFKLVNTKTVYLTESMPFYSPHIFLNINSSGDLDRLKVILESGQ